jgi:hypothetical protein
MTKKRTYKDNLIDGKPLSEDAAKFKEDWTAEQCVQELRKIAEEHPEKALTRNLSDEDKVELNFTMGQYL